MGIVLPRLVRLDRVGRARLLAALSAAELGALDADWSEWAHAGQRAPEGDWRSWVLMAGRGFGKTRAGAEWVQELVRAHGAIRIALVAATIDEARRVMVEGPSGLLAVAGAGTGARFEAARRRVVFAGGAEATLFSGANPEGLRGPEHHFAWCDELAKWCHPQESWDMLQLGLRAGVAPRTLVTTTPRSGVDALGRILRDVDTVLTSGSSHANPHLAPGWLAAMERAYGGTRRGREEIEGLFEADMEGALWSAELIDACRGAMPAAETLVRVVVGVDPPATAGGTCGIVVCGLDAAGIGHVLADMSRGGLSPEGWARRVAEAAATWRADRVVVETNQGGDMVRAVLRSVEARLPIRPVRAGVGKGARAEPVAALFESGEARFAGRFDALETELRGMLPGGYGGPGRSPDRADAMVWALTVLQLQGKSEPRVRLLDGGSA